MGGLVICFMAPQITKSRYIRLLPDNTLSIYTCRLKLEQQMLELVKDEGVENDPPPQSPVQLQKRPLEENT